MGRAPAPAPSLNWTDSLGMTRTLVIPEESVLLRWFASGGGFRAGLCGGIGGWWLRCGRGAGEDAVLVGLVGDVGQEVGHELQGLLGGGWAVGLLVRIIETDDQEKPVRDPEPVGRVLGAVVPGVELTFQVRDVEAFDIAARVRRQGVPVPFYAIARVKILQWPDSDNEYPPVRIILRSFFCPDPAQITSRPPIAYRLHVGEAVDLGGGVNPVTQGGRRCLLLPWEPCGTDNHGDYRQHNEKSRAHHQQMLTGVSGRLITAILVGCSAGRINVLPVGAAR